MNHPLERVVHRARTADAHAAPTRNAITATSAFTKISTRVSTDAIRVITGFDAIPNLTVTAASCAARIQTRIGLNAIAVIALFAAGANNTITASSGSA